MIATRLLPVRKKERGLTPAPPTIPRCPALLAAGLRTLPLAPLSFALTAYAGRVAKNHPGLFRRLGEHSRTRFILDPVDLPITLCLVPDGGGGTPIVRAVRGNAQGAARIAGPLAALLGLVHGAFDGDALFFSRDLVIEGDTAAALALRNAIDDAELDLSLEIAAMTGPFAAPVQRLFAVLERRTGVFLSRPEEAAAW